MNYHKTEYRKDPAYPFGKRFIVKIEHSGLKESLILKGGDKEKLQSKVKIQFKKWDSKFESIEKKKNKNASEQESLERTQKAKVKLIEIESILQQGITVTHKIKWGDLKKKDEYSKPNPKEKLDAELIKIRKPSNHEIKSIPREPDPTDLEFIPKFSLIEKTFKSLKNNKINECNKNFQMAHSVWVEEKKQIDALNLKLKSDFEQKMVDYEKKRDQVMKKYDELEKAWNEDVLVYEEKQKKYNSKIDQFKSEYTRKETKAVQQYCERVLNNSQYPKSFPKYFDLAYIPTTKIIIIEYALPSLENIPTLTEVRYIASKNKFSEIHLPDGQLTTIYDSTIYKIALRTIHEIFEADSVDTIEAVNFNGWVKTLNKATGKNENTCIVSVQARKKEFIELNLAKVDPKTCFKTLKGIGSSKLSGITAVQPILQIDKADKRIVDSRNVDFDSSSNLAVMNWEDFEHLIRELFEKEFTINGGEVRVTQASRDGGVDAIAFDPDPIRGGKIVIQAKRYTNVVGVSAVRDLYGTVMNEGATKGILVTTADYGSDSYEFAKGKPLTLLNGSNLLHLLEKHGQKARIDIKEARRLMYNK